MITRINQEVSPNENIFGSSEVLISIDKRPINEESLSCEIERLKITKDNSNIDDITKMVNNEQEPEKDLSITPLSEYTPKSFPAILNRRSCCCWKQKQIRNIKLNTKKMKTYEKWKWVLHRILLAIRVINALKHIQKDIQIYGAIGESQASEAQRKMSIYQKNEDIEQTKCVYIYIYITRLFVHKAILIGFGCWSL